MKHLKRILAVALLAVSLFAVALPALAETYTVNVNSAGLNVRTGPATTYPLAPVGKWYNGTVVTLNERSGSWARCTDGNGKSGWVMSSYLFPF